MVVSKRIAVCFLLAALLTSSGVSLLLQSLYSHTPDQRLPQIIGLVLVLVLIIVAGKLLYYQQILRHAKQNLDEAQQLAALGSWERDLLSGKGYWSDNLYRMFNLKTRAEAPSLEEFFMLIHPEDRQRVSETFKESISSKVSYEMKYRLADDCANRIFLNRGKVLNDDTGKPVTIIGTIQDVTNKHRRDQFREGLIKQKELFVTRLGHDLKTPLTPLVALMPLIRSRSQDQRQQELLDLCINSVSHINDLVTKTLQLARLTSSVDVTTGRLDVPLSEVVESAIFGMSEILSNHKTRIESSLPPGITILGDRADFEELFTQLFSNAVKFSPPDSRVSVEATCNNGLVNVWVSDSGIGLLPDELNNIFEDFYKADPSRHVLGSSGLGLTICRQIVENNGGKISASSPGRNGGTTISFTLEAGGSL